LGFTPTESIEFIPLIQALAKTDQVTQAYILTEKAVSMSKQVLPSACALWENLTQRFPEMSTEQVADFLSGKRCSTGQP